MTYSSVYESDLRQRRSELGPFSQLETQLKLASDNTYVLAMPKSRTVPEEGIVFKEFVDLIVSGLSKAKQVASYLAERYKTYIGIVKYAGQAPSQLQTQVEEASDIAKDSNESFHVYNPKKDSLVSLL